MEFSRATRTIECSGQSLQYRISAGQCNIAPDFSMRYHRINPSMSSVEQNFRQPPGPSEPLALGIDPETLATLTQLQREYGDMVCISKPNGRRAYFINDAAEIRRILTRRHSKYRKGPGFERVKMLLGNGLIVSDGAEMYVGGDEDGLGGVDYWHPRNYSRTGQGWKG